MSYCTSAYDFVGEPPAEVKCLICLRVAREPMQHESCGSLFCKECIDKHKPCPSCKQDEPAFFLNKQRENAIQALRVKCTNVKCTNVNKGTICDWTGTVKTLEAHVVACEFPLAFCPNQCKNEEGKFLMIARMTLAEHLVDCPYRVVKCEHCGEAGKYTYTTQAHLEACPALSRYCPRMGCTHKMQRGHIARHLETCEHTLVPCKYKNIGCKCEPKRKDLTKHEEESDKAHLHLALDVMVTLHDSNSTLEDSNARFVQSIAKLNKRLKALEITVSRVGENTGREIQNKLIDGSIVSAKTGRDIDSFVLKDSFTFKVTHVQKKSNEKKIFTSKPFYTRHGSSGYHMVAKVQFDRPYILVRAELVAGSFDDQLPWPFLGIISFRLLNQIQDHNHHVVKVFIGAGCNVMVGGGADVPCFITPEMLCRDSANGRQYLMDDTLYFMVNVVDYKAWLNCPLT